MHLYKALQKIVFNNEFSIESLASMSDIKTRYWIKLLMQLETKTQKVSIIYATT